MSRIGTRTLKKVLKILYWKYYCTNVYHADIWLGKMDHIEKWTEYFDARINNKTADLSEIYALMRLLLTSQLPFYRET